MHTLIFSEEEMAAIPYNFIASAAGFIALMMLFSFSDFTTAITTMTTTINSDKDIPIDNASLHKNSADFRKILLTEKKYLPGISSL